ncbi:MAG: DUF1553 domain-containing protein [Planctomycetes bacterium]|nr:DUF1553 domain-containing protein [Planctomycetota bacterium]MCW8135743.1 DUF1553 domain-containing protein [Planctomycetota bacterium]
MRNRTLPILTALAFCGAVFASLAVLQAPASAQDPDRKTTSNRDLSAVIDTEISKVWQRDSITPVAASGDEEFIRRVYFDTVGMPPTSAEVRAFLADKDNAKRAKLIDRLLADKRFGMFLADHWTNILVGRSGRDFGGTNHLFAVWFSERINAGAPFSEIIRDVITAEGQISANPAVAPYVRSIPARTADIAGNLTRNLTGVQIQCAECHDHPYEEKWTEQTFVGVASFYAPVAVQLNIRVVPVDPGVASNARPVRAAGNMDNLPAEARARLEEQRKYNKPVTLDGKPLLTPDRSLWRPALAKWTVSSENRQTARYIANRFWSFAFGMGILNPVDDFNSFNEASHPELLELLATDLIENNYDVRRLYRAILNSRTYQLSGKGRPAKAELWHFAAAPVRQLNAEQFFAAFLTVSGGNDMERGYRARVPSPGDALKRATERRMKQAEGENQRDITYSQESLDRFIAWYEKLDDGWFLRRNMAQAYARLSSDDEMNEAEGFTLTIDQALAVMNSDLTAALTGSGRGSVLQTVLREHKDDPARLDELFLRTLSRFPAGSERSVMLRHVKESNGSEAAWEDVLWALLAGTEFATNH